MQNTSPLSALIDSHTPDLTAMADRIWATPELLYAEFASVAEHVAMLHQKGFRVTEDMAGIPTAVMGEAGEGGPVIAILGEYDALPGLSQVAGIAEPRPVTPGGNGHGCGHNLLGSGAMLAACALKDWLEQTRSEELRVPGRGRWRRQGLHGSGRRLPGGGCRHHLAPRQPDAGGRSPEPCEHSRRFPVHRQVELMSVGVNYLREHVPQDARIHYAYLDAGGPAPNVVQASAKVRYSIRALQLSTMLDLVQRVHDVAKGAALMTGTSVEMRVFSAVSNMLGNEVLENLMQ